MATSANRRYLLVRARAVSGPDFEPSKPPYHDILAELSDPLPDEIPHGELRIFDERLLEQYHGCCRLVAITVLSFEISPLS